MDFADALVHVTSRQTQNVGTNLRIGTVSAVLPTLTVTIAGSDVPDCTQMGAYSPQIGDVVAVLMQRGLLLVLGALTTGYTGGAGGPAGPPGAAATVAVGGTTTGAPGTNAAVLNSGSTSAAMLNFTIPAGVAGATGPAGPPGTGSLSSRSTVSVTATALGIGVVGNGSVLLANGFVLYRVTTNRPARVRLYASVADRTADAARLVGGIPWFTSGLLLELVTRAGSLAPDLSPMVVGASLEAAPTSAMPVALTNLDTAAGDVTATFTFTPVEA